MGDDRLQPQADWVSKAKDLSNKVVVSLITTVLTLWLTRHFVEGLSLLGLALFVVVVTAIGIFASAWIDRLVEAHCAKKLRWVIVAAGLVLVVLWLGQPWPRIQNMYHETFVRAPVSSKLYLSETEAEDFVVERLRERTDRTVSPQRARFLLSRYVRQYERKVIGRFRCPEDSAWQLLKYETAWELFDMSYYTGARRLSGTTPCQIEYSLDQLENINWLQDDTRVGRLPIDVDE